MSQLANELLGGYSLCRAGRKHVCFCLLLLSSSLSLRTCAAAPCSQILSPSQRSQRKLALSSAGGRLQSVFMSIPRSRPSSLSGSEASVTPAVHHGAVEEAARSAERPLAMFARECTTGTGGPTRCRLQLPLGPPLFALLAADASFLVMCRSRPSAAPWQRLEAARGARSDSQF